MENTDIIVIFSEFSYSDMSLVADKLFKLIAMDPNEDKDKYIDRLLSDVDNNSIKRIIQELAKLDLINKSEVIEKMYKSIDLEDKSIESLIKGVFIDLLEIIKIQVIDNIYHEINIYPKKNRRKIINTIYKTLIEEYNKIKLEEIQETCEHDFGKWKEDYETTTFWYHKCKKCKLIESTTDKPEDINKKEKTMYRGKTIMKRLNNDNKKKKKDSK